MTSRLDRLFLLLENGATVATRHAAAIQIGEVVKLHPHEFNNLLDRLHSYITSKSWETRIAASQALNAIISNLPHWDPMPIETAEESIQKDVSTSENVGHLTLESFNIRRVLENGSYLFAADESQFEIDDENSSIDPKDKAAHQRLLVNQRLGLDIADALGLSTQCLFTNADLSAQTTPTSQTNKEGKNSLVQIVQEELDQAGLKMSSRELNRAKRKAKILNKQKSNDPTDKSQHDTGERKRLKSVHRSSEAESIPGGLESADESEWPLLEYSDLLSRDLFSNSWEIRHGSATALREIIRQQGHNAGKRHRQTVQQIEDGHLSWLEDKAIRLVCVLALDRFGDFLSDQVVAPVRETSAQVLGCIALLLPNKTALSVMSLLQELLIWPHWGTRHGGLLGMKYLLAVRTDMRKDMLKKSFSFIYRGLQDETDDVVAVAATCLVPVAEDLLDCICPSTISDLVGTLWEALLEIDDLTASTNSILSLISKLLSYPVILNRFTEDLGQLISRLWPFLYHSNTTVRTSSLKALETLVRNLAEQRKNFCDDLTMPSLEDEDDSESKPAVTVGHTPVSQCTRTDQNVVPQIIKTEAPDQNQDKVPIKMELNEEEIKMEIHEEPIDYGDVVAETKQKLNISKESGEAKVALSWLEDVLESIMCHVFQRGLLECHPENRELIVKIWNLVIENASLSHLLVVSCRLVPSWLCLLMTAAKMPLDTNFLVLAYHSPKIAQGESPKKLRHACDLGERVGKIENAYYIGGSRDGLTAEEVEERVVMSRCIVARLIGHLSQYVCQPMPGIEYKPNDTPVLCYVRLLSSHLQSRSGVQRYCAGLVAREWAIMHPKTLCHTLLKTSLLNCLVETIYFDEITWMFTRLQQEVRDFVALMRHYKVEFDANFISKAVYTLEEIRDICEKTNYNSIKQRKNVAETLETRSKSILKNVSLTSTDQVKLAITVQSVIAGALLRFKSLPEKLNPVIKPLMESIKRETVPQHQLMAAQDLTFLMELCVDRQPSPNAKVVKNLAVFLCADESFTPNVIDSKSSDLHGEILAISLSTKPGAVGFVRRDSGSEPRRPGRPPKVNPSTSSEKLELSENPKEAEAKLQATIQRRGCTMSLTSIAKYFGQDLSTELPHFIELIFENLENPKPDLYFTSHLVERTQEIVNWLQLLEVIIPALHECYLQKFLPVLDSLTSWLYNSYSAVRHMSSRAFAVLANAESVTSPVVGYLIEEVLPKFERIDSDKHRMGALECLHLTIEKLGFNVIPYIVLLIIPLLGRMSDPIDVVRHLATRCFASLIRLYPLDGESNRLLRSVDPKLTLRIASERAFLDQLLDPRKIENYVIPVPIKAELRPYQQSGVNWMAFLNKFKLHGILCDDMGLGKTLQSICILAGDHYYKDKDNKNKVESPCKKGCQSLVICPPTLTGHWYYEVLRFVSREYLDPLHYTGPPVERKKLQCEFRNHNLIIASYKIVRNEIDFFSKIRWNYIILDEGHVIKNGKTKSSRAIKELIGQHRLILSGTPIQNNVLELWSLFDFLMPGFLGTERQFITKYSKPIIQSKEAKSSSKEQEAGVLALEALHRQVLPFLLRRVKEDVLQDLPPKITQDYYCDLSPLQERLYEDFTRSRNLADVNESDADSKNSPKDHVFQALQYLRRVCNHPKLVLTTSHPQYEAIVKHVKNTKISLDDIDQSAKLPALKQLLLDCGIGCAEENPSNVLNPSAVVAPHRALIFCQLKGMLDIIERDLLKMHLPTVSYLRLDGSVPAGDRHSLVQKFNSDPSIDLLLLTTHVGGLGLNLTGADTVIFVEHDWNPMRDLQAMDRAHRIGQKRVVNVYRLITKGTLEEKIMSLQKFKLMTANCVIGQENSSLLSMGTEQLLELFVLDTKKGNSSEISNSSNGSDTFGIQSPGFKKALEALPALWEENAYEEEYNIDTFLQKLR